MSKKVVLSPHMTRAQDVAAVVRAGSDAEVVFTPPMDDRSPADYTPAEIDEYLRDADVLMVSLRERVPRSVLEQLPRLRSVCSMVIGTENIDVGAATELGIVVGHGPVPENTVGMAEAIVMLSGMLLKRVPAKQQDVREGGWRAADAGRLVAGSTIGLIGFGGIGQAAARRFAGWECRVLAADPYASPEAAERLGVELVELDRLLQESDVVSLQVVLTDETRGLIEDRAFSLMKPSAYLVNTSRGDAIDEAALLRALDEGRIAGAAIDTWWQEPAPADHPLRNHPKVIATGHCVGHSLELYDSIVRNAGETIIRLLRGEPPVYTKNPAVLERWRARVAELGRTAGDGRS